MFESHIFANSSTPPTGGGTLGGKIPKQNTKGTTPRLCALGSGRGGVGVGGRRGVGTEA